MQTLMQTAAHICALPAMKWGMQHCKTAQPQKIAIIMLAFSNAFTKGEKPPSFFSLIDSFPEHCGSVFLSIWKLY